MSGFSQQVFLRFSHAVACTKTSIHFTTKPFADRGYLTFCLPVNWLTLGHLDLTEAMGIHIQVSAWTQQLHLFWWTGRSKTAGQSGASMSKPLKSFQVALQSDWASLSPPAGTTRGLWFFHTLSSTCHYPCLFGEPHPDGLRGSSPRFHLLLPGGCWHRAPFYVSFATSTFEVMWHFLCPFSSLVICTGFSACKISFVFPS